MSGDKVQKVPLEIKAGTTFRAGFRFGENYGADDEVVYDQSEITSADFKIRSSDYTYTETIPMVHEDDAWWVVIAASVTDGYNQHRAMYYGVDCTFASGDVVRMTEGPLRVRTIGGH